MSITHKEPVQSLFSANNARPANCFCWIDRFMRFYNGFPLPIINPMTIP